MFAKQYRYSMSPYVYAISPLGAYNIGMTEDFLEKCKELKIKTEVDEKILKVIKPDMFIDKIVPVPNTTYKYRDYQEKLLRALTLNGRGVIVSPTRSGKSLVLAGLCHNTFLNAEKNKIKSILLVVPNVNLVMQMAADFEEYGIANLYNIQKFTANELKKKTNNFHIKEKNNIFIANMQYLMKNGDQLGYIDMIIQDEVHVISKGSELGKLVKGVDIPFKFGCTGTLPKSIENKWQITGIFGPVLEEVKIKELQEKNVLADVKITPIEFMHSLKVNFNKQEEENESVFDIASRAYRKESMYLGEYIPTNTKILELAKRIIATHNDWNVLILFDYISQGEQLYNLLDFEHKHYVDGSVDVDIRHEIIEEMNSPEGGHITIANCKCFGTGLTIKRIQAIFLVQNASSVTKIIQSIGRGLQKNKETLYLFDIIHNYKYSQKHFKERVQLYKEFYNKELGKDYQIKTVIV